MILSFNSWKREIFGKDEEVPYAKMLQFYQEYVMISQKKLQWQRGRRWNYYSRR